MALPDLAQAPLGERLRYLRKRRGLTRIDLAQLTGVSDNTIARMERGEVEPEPARLSAVLSFFGDAAREVLPGGADIYDHVIPVTDFGSWLRNFRLRRGMPQKDLAEALGVHKVTVCRYENGATKPDAAVVRRLKRRFKLDSEFNDYDREV